MTYEVRVSIGDSNKRETIAVDAVSVEQAAMLCRDRGRVIWVRDLDEDGWQDVTEVEDKDNGGS